MGTFTPLGSRERDNLCGGVVGMAFDIDSANITSFTMRPFQNEDMNILLNTKTKKVQRDQWLDLISMVGTTMTDYGAVVAVGRNYRVASMENNGTVSTEFFRVGLHLVAIDTTGHVRWARNLRRNDCQRKDVDLLGVNLVSFDGKVLVARSEPHRTPAIYDISNVAKKLKMGDKSSLALYTIAADGEVQKQILETKSKHSLIRSIVRRDGTLMMITENGRRLRLAEAKKEVSGD